MIDEYIAKKLKELIKKVEFYNEYYDNRDSLQFSVLKDHFDRDDLEEDYTMILKELMEELFPEDLKTLQKTIIKDYWSSLEYCKEMPIDDQMEEIALYSYNPILSSDDGEYFDLEEHIEKAEEWITQKMQVKCFIESDESEVFERYAGVEFAEWLKANGFDINETMEDIESSYGSIHAFFADSYGEFYPETYINVELDSSIITLQELETLPHYDNSVFISNGYGYNEISAMDIVESECKILLSLACYDYTTNTFDPVISFVNFMRFLQEVKEYVAIKKCAA